MNYVGMALETLNKVDTDRLSNLKQNLKEIDNAFDKNSHEDVLLSELIKIRVLLEYQNGLKSYI